MLKRSSTPAVLLALLVLYVTLFAASPRTTVAKMAAAPAPLAITVPAPATVDVPVPVTAALVAPAALPEAVPAVTTTRATPAFSKDVKGLSPEILAMALDAVECARARGVSGREDLLTVIDYSLPSTEPRLWVLDLERGEVLFHELVAHGAGTGDNYATQFSNVKDSRQTSLGLFLTHGTYEGGNGYSLKLEGLDQGINDRAEERYIVMHGAWYVSPEQIRSQGRLGRSWGCPALSQEIAPTVIDRIKGGSFIFSYAGRDESFQSFQKASSQTCGGDAGPATGGVSTVSMAR